MEIKPIDFELREFAYASLVRVPLFKNLKPHTFESMFDCFTIVEYEVGETIISQGRTIDSLLVLLQGKVSINALNKSFENVIISELSAPCAIGEISLLLEGKPTATVKAVGRIQALKISKEDFLAFFENLPGFGLCIAQGLSERVADLTQKYVKEQQETIDYSNLRKDANGKYLW